MRATADREIANSLTAEVMPKTKRPTQSGL